MEQSRLTGTIQANKTLWEVVGELKGDSLFLSMTTVTDRRFLRLKKISKNPKFNINKLMTGKSSLDIGLIGEWLLLKTYNADGTEKPIKDTKDMRYRINSDGSLVMDSPYISRFISLNHGSFPTFKWETSGAKFIQTGGSIGRGQSVVIESTYHVSSDTLILEYRGSKDIMVRIKKKIKK